MACQKPFHRDITLDHNGSKAVSKGVPTAPTVFANSNNTITDVCQTILRTKKAGGACSVSRAVVMVPRQPSGMF